MVGDATRTHGLSKTAEYKIWCGINRRCNNKKEKSYKNYGGRGVKVCERWSGEDGFENFLSDMGTRPSPQHEIDRYPDNSGNYEPDAEVFRYEQNMKGGPKTRKQA